MKTYFILNPISGKKQKGEKRREMLEMYLSKTKREASIWETEYAGHATKLTKKALDEGADRVVSVGGDGTINEVAKAMVGSGVPFGLVPMGSGNGLARHLGIPLGFEKALDNIFEGEAQAIDSGEANGVAFFNVMGIGFDAEIGKRFNETHARGFASYWKVGTDTIKTYEPSEYELEVNGEEHELEAYIIAVANSSQYGSNAYVAPDASVRDGKLNLVAIKKPSFTAIFTLLYRFFTRTLYKGKRVKAFCSDRFRLKLKEKSFFHADGEIYECSGSLDIVVRPNSLRVIFGRGAEV
ncbi:MAG: diacylglycerol kinase family protein [Verrucomicrobiota bacterium]